MTNPDAVSNSLLFDDFTNGLICAASHLIRVGQDIYALEILNMAGITPRNWNRIEAYDRKILKKLKVKLK